MRGSQGRRVALTHRNTLESVPATGQREPASALLASSAFLSPQEQRRRVIDVARAFDGHYLATIDFIAERNLTVGIVKPVHGSSADIARTVQVCVDARGNVSVCPSDRPRHVVTPAVVGRWLTGLAALCAALIALLG